MGISKIIARKVVFPAMMGLGVDKIMLNTGPKKLLNVMYHGVVRQDSSYFSPRHIQKDQFEEHLKYFSKNFKVISLKEAFHIIQNNIPLKENTLTVSFDDGFKNNLDVALPLIEKYKIPTTFFISSLSLDDASDDCIWAEYIAALNHFYKDEPVTVNDYTFVNLVDKSKNISLIEYLKSCSYQTRDEVLHQLITKYDLAEKLKQLPEEIWKLMTKEELITFSKSDYVTIGSHGHLHYNLGDIDFDKAKSDMILSKKLLEETMQKPMDMIAYPNGSYNSNIKDLAEQLGFKYQLAVNYRTEEDKNDLRILDRHSISSGTTFESNILFLSKALKTRGIVTGH